MRHCLPIVACLIVMFLPLFTHEQSATPDAAGTPIATPVVFIGCEDLGAYFTAVAMLANGNDGYLAVRSNPDGVFQVDATEAATRVTSLEELLAALGTISPPAEAAPWHAAFTAIVTWYRDLASAPDMATYQRVVNQDKWLIPALSRAGISGQAACGADVWQDAYDAAFGVRQE